MNEDANLRVTALDMAVKYHTITVNATNKEVVATAEAFHAFLEGAS